MSLKAAIIPVTPFVQNCTLLWCTETKQAAVVDPGGDIDRINQAIEENGVTLIKVIITHGHMDHAGGAATLAEHHSVPIEGPHKEDKFLLDGLAQQGQQFGLADAKSFTPDRWLDDGDTVTFGNITLNVCHCPGHTPGHIVLYNAEHKLALVGDVLFQGSIGRTDFPRGDHPTLIRSIKNKLWPLGNDTTFISGHGPISTFGHERQTNAYVADGIID